MKFFVFMVFGIGLTLSPNLKAEVTYLPGESTNDGFDVDKGPIEEAGKVYSAASCCGQNDPRPRTLPALTTNKTAGEKSNDGDR